MAKLEPIKNGNLPWWLNCFTSSNLSWSIANTFVRTLKSDVIFTHPLENAPKTSSFLYRKDNNEIFISIPFNKEKSKIIFSLEFGRKLNLIPKIRPYNKEHYSLENLGYSELIDKVDKYITLM